MQRPPFVPLHRLQVAKNETFPECQVGLLCCWHAWHEFFQRSDEQNACSRERSGERIARQPKEDDTKGAEKALKGGAREGAGVRVKPEEAWILTACGGLGIPLTDVHNHPRRLIIIMTAMTTGESQGRDWLVDNPLNWAVKLFTLELPSEAEAKDWLVQFSVSRLMKARNKKAWEVGESWGKHTARDLMDWI